MKHVQQAMRALQARFGALQPKEGQDISAVTRSWERALGIYQPEAVLSVCRHWCDTTKYSRWPEVGELLEMLKDWGHKPVRDVQDDRPLDVKQAEEAAGVWYRHLIGQPNERAFYPNSVVLGCVLDELYPPSEKTKGPRSFSFLLTRAFMHGFLPDQWEMRRDAFLNEVDRRHNLYRDAVAKHGAVRVHEAKNWMALG